jgi:hypothetical protein
MPNIRRKRLKATLASESEEDDINGKVTFEERFRNTLDKVHPVNCQR